MTDKAKPTRPSGIRMKQLECRRTGQMFSPSEHAQCPYCYADARTVGATGDYADFCDFKPGKDPIIFGFPPDSTRTLRG